MKPATRIVPFSGRPGGRRLRRPARPARQSAGIRPRRPSLPGRQAPCRTFMQTCGLSTTNGWHRQECRTPDRIPDVLSHAGNPRGAGRDQRGPRRALARARPAANPRYSSSNGTPARPGRRRLRHCGVSGRLRRPVIRGGALVAGIAPWRPGIDGCSSGCSSPGSAGCREGSCAQVRSLPDLHERQSRGLIIRRSWVRAPPAPLLRLTCASQLQLPQVAFSGCSCSAAAVVWPPVQPPRSSR